MKIQILTLLALMLGGCSTVPTVFANNELGKSSIEYQSVLAKKQWIHGSEDCSANQDPVVDTYRHDAQTFILRQNKCLTFEAPFIYVLMGKSKVLILDTGDIADMAGFSMYDEVKKIVGDRQLGDKEVIVLHSHGHRDHYRGDVYFAGQPNVIVVQPTSKSVRSYFGFSDWPSGEKVIDLGDRKITVIPSPGHQEEAITLYDHHTKWLLTGDTLYSGLIYVKHWKAYRESIARLASFSRNHEVSAILGTHIEAKKGSTEIYPIGTTYQPHEADLDMGVQNLYALEAELEKHPEPARIVFRRFTLEPMGGLQKTISNIVRWFTQ